MKKYFFIAVFFIFIMLSGCSFNGNFSRFVNEDIKSIVVEIDTKSLGEISTYSSKDQEIIKSFLGTMNSMPLKKTNRGSSVFNETYKLYNENNEIILTVVFTGENIAVINGTNYKINEVTLINFTNKFYSDENFVKNRSIYE